MALWNPPFPRRRFFDRITDYFGLIAVVLVVAAAGVSYYSGYLPQRIGNEGASLAPVAKPIAIDGDGLRIDGEEIRIYGIDAPELLQTCKDARGAEWQCGRAARDHLRAIVSRGPVHCIGNSRDRFGRRLARCSADGVADIGETMVRAGYAVVFMIEDYRSAEDNARRNKRGIWAGEFQMPFVYRQQHPRTAER
jgi:endonuclease YncB( thermonuclease family)